MEGEGEVREVIDKTKRLDRIHCQNAQTEWRYLKDEGKRAGSPESHGNMYLY